MQKLGADTNSLNWFEIPALDLERAKVFYESIFDIALEMMEMMEMKMAFFPSQPPNVGGALCQSEYHKPSTDGPVIYLNGNPDLQLVLDRIEKAGGQIIMPKTHISDEIGYMAFFIDSEGNRMALHSNN